MDSTKARTGGLATRLRALIIALVATISFAVLMEWLFFVTKPSFFSAVALTTRVQVLLGTILIALVLVLPGALLLWLLARLGGRHIESVPCLVPAGILVTSVVLLLDNFTHTLTGLGIAQTRGVVRGAYLMLVLLGLAFVFARLSRATREGGLLRCHVRWLFAVSIGFLCVLLLSAIPALLGGAGEAAIATAGAGGPRPDILFIGTDGLDATHVSAYGYERQTTPFIDSRLGDALVLENAFSNSANTTGGVVALLTGRLPTETRVQYRPDILRGADSFRHLPGILRRFGYKNLQAASPHYADAFDLNMRGAFDRVNFRDASRSGTAVRFLPAAISHRFQTESYFLGQIIARAGERLNHLSGRSRMIDPYAEVTAAKRRISDGDRIGELLDFARAVDGPYLAHLHLLGTHGRAMKFHPRIRQFSRNSPEKASKSDDHYDDTVLGFDSHIQVLFEGLEELGRLRTTVIILHSDHGRKWKSTTRVPLIIWFPQDEHAGRVEENVQLTDLAPTVLDYMGIEVPEWMSGRRILSERLDPEEPIFSVLSVPDGHAKLGMVVSDVGPPFFSFHTVYLTICDRWWSLILRSGKLGSGSVDGHTAPCPASAVPSDGEAREAILSHLSDHAFRIEAIGLG
jgi:arylsulfatase A-like enzyme